MVFQEALGVSPQLISVTTIEMQCPKCEYVNPEQAKFCNNCGQKLIGICAHCGTQNPEGANFCSDCGSKLLFVEPVKPSKRKAERRQLTVLFCDLVGSTPLSEALDAEDYREVILDYQQVAEAAIKKNGGHIAQYLGDGLLVYFGYPRGLENAPKAAVKSGLDILEAINKANKVWAQEGKTEIAIRIGIHTGLVVVDEHLALGDTVNIAARLEGLALENGLVISNYTQKLVSGWFEMESLGVQTLKGIKEPMEIYQVLKASGAGSRIEIAAGRGLSPLVGREDELNLLLRKWNQAKAGNGQFLILNGEAGIGKSRLVQSIKGQVKQEKNAARLEIRCSDYQTTTPFYPLIELLENRVLAFAREEESESKIEKLKNWMNFARLALKPHLPIYSDFLSISIPDELRAQYESQLLVAAGKRKKFMDGFTTALLHYAKEAPLLLIVEDLHWMDSSTLEWFNQVVEQLPTYTIFVVATTRPQFQAPWPTKSYIAQLNLNRLSNDQIEMMCYHQAKGKVLPKTLLKQITDKTNGVPLFVEELTRMIIESDLLLEKEDHFELSPIYQSRFELAIPSTLQDSLIARLDRLSDSREIAQIGSVLGREFSYKLIEAVAQRTEEGLQKDLSKLVASELLYQKGLGRAATYLFKHALIQDTAYESLLKRRRQQLHKRVAMVLEQQFPELVETQPELLAYHANEAGLNEKALEMWELAGNKAVRQHANFDAVYHFQKALSLLHCISDETRRMDKELDLLLPYSGALMVGKG